MSNLSNVHKCGLNEVILFLLAIIFGTGCSICSKTMMSLRGTNGTLDGNGLPQVELFQKPLFQTFGMFVGMMFGLIMHWFVVAFNVSFPGYDSDQDGDDAGDVEIPTEKTSLFNKMKAESNIDKASKEIPMWMYFFLAIPAIFDLAATALCMMGLQYLDVSIYQMLRGSGIIFVALMKQNVLKDRLHNYHWVGVFWNVVSVVIVGGTAMLASGGEDSGGQNPSKAQTFLGVSLMMAGAFVQAVQFVFEEHVMNMDIPAPPLLLIGMEGLWGTILSVTLMYPLGYYLPGSDHGSYEDPFNTWAMFKHSRNIQVAFFIYFFTIFFYNLFAVLVTFQLSSVWHAILDNFRPITVWGTDLFIYYCINPLFGECWTQFSYLQIVGMAVLLYGTAIYNAPNAGSLLLEGQWWAFGIDLSKEYEQIKLELEEAEMDAKWEMKRQEFKVRTHSSFIESPRISIHTQALRGIGAQHN
jgi:multidrug transporter EmrE-like cation transporter